VYPVHQFYCVTTFCVYAELILVDINSHRVSLKVSLCFLSHSVAVVMPFYMLRTTSLRLSIKNGMASVRHLKQGGKKVGKTNQTKM